MKLRGLVSLCIVLLLVLSNTFSSLAFIYLPGLNIMSASIANNHSAIYNQDGGFVITNAMLDMPYNKITFPGTHNSFASSGFLSTERNQDLSITAQLENGIRVFDFDLDMFLALRHGSTAVPLNPRLESIKNYAAAHPNQIITVRINDYASTSGNMYSRVNGRLEDTGLDDYIYNWNPNVAKDNSGRCYIPHTWPTLRQMIDAGKNVLFIHNSGESGHDIVDSSASRGLKYSDFKSTKTFHHYGVQNLEEFSRIHNIWDPAHNDRQKNGANRLFHIEVCPDGSSAGDRNAATKNNDGRRLYQIAKQYETELLPDGRVPYVIAVDFFKNNTVNNLPINVVDACNRLNAERAGVDFRNSSYSWELYPYEFSSSKKELLSGIASVQNEIKAIYNDYVNGKDLDGHEDKGDIVSTTYQRLYDFDRMPEYAIDNDFNTRWTGSSSRPNHTWGIDLGAQYELTDIAIAWEFSHKIPAYTVYVSNDHRRFRDDMNNKDLLSDSGWTKAVIQPHERGNLSTPIPWDMGTLSGKYRYIKIKVTDADSAYWPAIQEIKLYGPK